MASTGDSTCKILAHLRRAASIDRNASHGFVSKLASARDKWFAHGGVRPLFVASGFHVAGRAGDWQEMHRGQRVDVELAAFRKPVRTLESGERLFGGGSRLGIQLAMVKSVLPQDRSRSAQGVALHRRRGDFVGRAGVKCGVGWIGLRAWRLRMRKSRLRLRRDVGGRRSAEIGRSGLSNARRRLGLNRSSRSRIGRRSRVGCAVGSQGVERGLV